MRSAFFTAVLAAYIGSAAAQPPAPVNTLHNESIKSIKLQPARETTARVNAVYTGTAQPRELAPTTPAIQSQQSDESGWRSYGTLLATLMLMVVIAVRRYSGPRH